MENRGEQINPSANDPAGGEGRGEPTPTELSEHLAHGDRNSPATAMAQKGESRPSGKHEGGVYGTSGQSEENQEDDSGSPKDQVE